MEQKQDCVVEIYGTPKIQLYVNERGRVCIKQENDDFENEDPYIYFSIVEAESIIAGIKKTVEEAKKRIDNDKKVC